MRAPKAAWSGRFNHVYASLRRYVVFLRKRYIRAGAWKKFPRGQHFGRYFIESHDGARRKGEAIHMGRGDRAGAIHKSRRVQGAVA